MMLIASFAKDADRARRIGAQLVGKQQRADRTTLPGRQIRPTPSARPPAALRGAPIRERVVRSKIISAEPALTLRPSTRPRSPVPICSSTASGILRSEAALHGGLHQCRRQDVMRGLFERGAEPQDLVGGLVGRRFYREKARAADGQSPGLVEEDGMCSRQRFQRAPAFDEDPQASCLRDAGNECDRGRQNERQGVAATNTARARMRSPERYHAMKAITQVNGRKASAYLSASRTKGARAVCAAVTIRTMPE